jgi:hypothetical protein
MVFVIVQVAVECFVLQADDWCSVTMTDKIVGICVKKHGSPGIVSVNSDNNYCLTCRKNYCEHCKCLEELKTCSGSITDVVDQLTASNASGGDDRNRKTSPKVFSKKRISFCASDTTTSVLRNLSAIDQLSILCPSLAVPCQCGCIDFEECSLYEECDVITMTCVTKVKGECFSMKCF